MSNQTEQNNAASASPVERLVRQLEDELEAHCIAHDVPSDPAAAWVVRFDNLAAMMEERDRLMARYLFLRSHLHSEVIEKLTGYWPMCDEEIDFAIDKKLGLPNLELRGASDSEHPSQT